MNKNRKYLAVITGILFFSICLKTQGKSFSEAMRGTLTFPSVREKIEKIKNSNWQKPNQSKKSFFEVVKEYLSRSCLPAGLPFNEKIMYTMLFDFLKSLGSSKGDDNFNPNFDFDGDGYITGVDFNRLRNLWKKLLDYNKISSFKTKVSFSS